METRSASYYHHMDHPSTLMLLMEDSGDSSELADQGSNSRPLHLPDDDDDDDAESCSWDSSDQRSRKRELDSIGHCYKQEKKARKEEEEEEEEYQERWTSVGLMVKQKSCVSEESKANELPMNEVERNRLFWEACLAS